MKKSIFSLLFAMLSCVAFASSKSINNDWKFSLGDFPTAKNVKFDDSKWENLNLPHDWAFERGYSEHGAQKGNGGYAMGGIGWYRKSLNVTADDIKGKRTFIDFEGVYMNSEVWINGTYLGKRPYGYISFSYELTKYLKVGSNLITVRVDNSLEPSARWYHGCGIYSNVHLRSVGSTFFEKDGTYITTPSITAQSGEVAISAEIVAAAQKGAKLSLVITNSKGKEVAKQDVAVASLKNGLNSVKIGANVAKPALWSPENPNLYYAALTLTSSKGVVLDSNKIRFGFRTVEWHAKTGFHLNGKQYKLRGVCEHMEGGPTGATVNEVVLRWRLQQLKDMGCNSIRTAHNPYWPIFYHLCDEMGILVMDEIFDGWSKKADHDYGAQAFDEWWERDLRAWIRRDRNHPSVFLWSVGNETHGDIAPTLVKTCGEEDPTRLVTSGDCNPDDMTVYGVNGRSEKIDTFLPEWEAKNLDKAFVATENPHTWQVRGFYRSLTWYRNGYPNERIGAQYIPNFIDKEIFGYGWTSPELRRSTKQVYNSSYDNATVRVTARHLLEVLRDVPWFSGSFRWTGYDYLGEASYVHGGWPFRAFQSGALDLAGFPKDLYYLYQSEWTTKRMVHILPHWTHPAMQLGEKVPVVVYTNGDEAELFINNRSLGRKKKGKNWEDMQMVWLVPYEEGVIDVVAYKNGKMWSKAQQMTSNSPRTFSVKKYENRELKADGQDVTILSMTQLDEIGTMYPYGENRLYAKIFGDAKMYSFENGSPVDVETNYNAESRNFFFGLNRMFIQSTSTDSSKPVSVLMASIMGDKKLMLSDYISIYVSETMLRGKKSTRNLAVYYTTDGTTPTKKSTYYNEPFKVKLGTTVKAVVYEGDELLLSMEEKFTQEDGIYWGTPGEPVCKFDGEQAETAKLQGAYRTKFGDNKVEGGGFYGDAFVRISKVGGSVTWYQENDGAPFEGLMTIRYAQELPDNKTSKMEVWNDKVKVGEVEFTNTGSLMSHWGEVSIKMPFKSGGNNIRLVSLTADAPSIDQAKFK